MRYLILLALALLFCSFAALGQTNRTSFDELTTSALQSLVIDSSASLESYRFSMEMEQKIDLVNLSAGDAQKLYTRSLGYCLANMTEEAVRLGIARGKALRLAKQTMFGTAKLLLAHKIDPEALIADVASSRGTTAAGLEVLEKSGAGLILRKTIRAAADRSRQLSRSVCGRA
jgi:hypothetical protein